MLARIMQSSPQLPTLLAAGEPLLALAPMQDVTDLPFWRLMSGYGGPDVYWTEYFRVHATSTLERGILDCILRNPTGRPAVAQLIGNDIPSLVRAARDTYPHDFLADRYYVTAVQSLDTKASTNQALRGLLEDGCAQLDAGDFSANQNGLTPSWPRCARRSAGPASPSR